MSRWLVIFLSILSAVCAEAQILKEAYVVETGGRAREYEVACDELQCEPKTGDLAHPLAIVDQGTGAATVARSKALAQASGHRFDLVLYPKGAARNEKTRRVLTRKILVKLGEGADAAKIAGEAGAAASEAPDYAPGYLILEFAEAGDALTKLEGLRGRADCLSAEPVLGRKHFHRLVPNDPRYRYASGNQVYQWHLNNTGQNGGTSGMDIDVDSVWDTRTGLGVRIGIVDDGLEISHPDLAPNVDTSTDHDWNDGSPNDPTPTVSDWHGSNCAGVAAARGSNGIGITGAAPRAGLVGLRLIAGSPTDAQEAEAMTWYSSNGNIIHIKSNSWGPADDAESLEAPGPLMTAALKSTATSGRGGRGTIHVWAGGNGGSSDNINYDGYANSIYTIAVGAVNHDGVLASYSEPGAAKVVCAPSSGDTADQRLTTTDLLVYGGYSDDFGGTSAACPLVAGVCALVLEENPNLGWRDLQEILMRSARKVNPSGGGWATNGAGLSFSHSYGAGLVNARDAVALAKTWTNLGPQLSQQTTDSSLPRTIPDNSTLSRNFTFSAGSAIRVEHATVTLDIDHQSRGQLRISLVSPSGTESVLTEAHADTNDDYPDWTLMSVHHWGESSAGVWTLKVKDSSSGTTGKLNRATVKLWGSNVTPVLTSAGSASGERTQPFSFAVTATNGPTSFTATNLPAGLAIDPATGIISGIPADQGSFTVSLTVSNGVSSASGTLLLEISPPPPMPPVITNAPTARGILDQPFFFQIRADFEPTSFGVSWLSPGLSLDPLTGEITGRPSQTGVFTITLTAANSYGSDALSLALEVGPPGPFNAALEEAEHWWSTEGNAAWFSQTAISTAGGDAARSGAIAHTGSSILGTEVRGPGLLSFYWKVSSEMGGDFLSVNIDGVKIQRISGERAWEQAWVSVPAGYHEVTWAYTKNASVVAGSDAGFLDAVEYRRNVMDPAHPTLGQALDFPGLAWTTHGQTDWEAGTVTHHDGADAAQSGVIGIGATSSIETTVTGPGRLSFWWKTSALTNASGIRFYVGAANPATIAGPTDWTPYSLDLPAGEHTLTWVFIRGPGGNTSEAGWLDEVAWAPTGASGFEVWQGRHFTASEQAEPDMGQEAADPDGDGRSNLMEYAQGSDPLVPDASEAVIDSSSGALSLTFERDTTKADLQWVVELSEDVEAWSEVPTQILNTSGTLELRRASVPLSPSRQIMRLKVSR